MSVISKSSKLDECFSRLYKEQKHHENSSDRFLGNSGIPENAPNSVSFTGFATLEKK